MPAVPPPRAAHVRAALPPIACVHALAAPLPFTLCAPIGHPDRTTHPNPPAHTPPPPATASFLRTNPRDGRTKYLFARLSALAAGGQLNSLHTNPSAHSHLFTHLPHSSSRPQVDESERGFSFIRDGPLDMRMDPSGAQRSAEELVNTASEVELGRIIRDLGEERYWKGIARRCGGACGVCVFVVFVFGSACG